MRTTTAWLKKAWARRIATALPRRSTPSRPRGPEQRRGTPRPPRRSGARTGTTSSGLEQPAAAELVGGEHVGGRQRRSTSVSTVDAAACHSVNQATCRSSGSPSTSPHPAEVPAAARRAGPRRRCWRPATRRSTARNATRRGQEGDRRPRPRLTAARGRSTGRSSPPGWRRSPRAGARTPPSGVAACSTNTSRQLDAVARREHEHRQRHVGLHRLGQQEVDRAGRASASCSVPARIPAPSTCR